jgi:hypothetical protein
VADNLEEASENIAAISDFCWGKEFSCDTEDFVWSDDHLATHYSSEAAGAVSPTYKSQHHWFSLINRYVPCNMI